MTYSPVIVELTSDDKNLIQELAMKQTQLYGHDRGFFRLGRSDSSHEIGFEGEVAFVRWAHNTLPQESYYFGVHYGQDIENSGAPVVLMSYLRSDNTHIKIEGFMTSERLSKCRIIKRGETFPGMSYPSRTDNWLTRIGDYETISNLVKHLKEDR